MYYPFSFYYETCKVASQRFMFIMQNPGQISGFEKSAEYKDLLNNANEDNFTEVMRKWFSIWLLGKNKNFSINFFETLRRSGLISYDSIQDYIGHESGGFYEDFIVTDLVKCRKDTKDIANENIEICGNTYLSKEIDSHNNIELIFSFSTRTWEYLRKTKLKSQDNTLPVSNAHGRLYKLDNSDKYIIPLAHFSQTIFNYYLRNSYFDYLKDGLQSFTSI